MQFDPITNAAVGKLKKHFELIYGSADATAFVFDPSITAASLETWLSTPANSAAFSQMLATYIGPPALIANTTTLAAVVDSSTAMAAVAASSTAMAAVAASSTAMAAVAASSTAMAAVAASSTAMAAVIASSTAKMAVHGSDTALNAIKASATAMAAMRADGNYLQTANAAIGVSPASITALNGSGTYILLGVSSSNAGPSNAMQVATLRSGSAISSTGITVPSTSSDAKRIDLAIPLVAPYTANNTSGSNFSWAMGFIRCDV